MTGLEEAQGSWGYDDGAVRFGDDGMALTLLDDGFLRYGTELSGYMIFSQDAKAKWDPTKVPAAPAVTAAPTAAPTAVPQAPSAGAAEYLNTKFVCKSTPPRASPLRTCPTP